MNRFLVGSVLAAFTVVVIGMGVLIAIDTEHAQLYLGVIGLLAVLGTVLTFGALLHMTGRASDRDRRETYARVMIALVTATAGTVGGVGGGAVVVSNQNDAVKQDAAAAIEGHRDREATGPAERRPARAVPAGK